MDDSLYKSDLIDLQEIDTKIDNLLIDKESSDRVESLKHAEQEYKSLQNRLKEVLEGLKPFEERLDNYEATLEKHHLNLDSNMKSQSNTNVPSELTNYISQQEELFIYPDKHFVLPDERIKAALADIHTELNERLEELRRAGKLLEAQRLSARTRFDLEMMQEVGYCPGIENYSRPLSGRPSGTPPYTLYSYFPHDFLLFVDESHVTIPQVRAMFAGDRSR